MRRGAGVPEDKAPALGCTTIFRSAQNDRPGAEHAGRNAQLRKEPGQVVRAPHLFTSLPLAGILAFPAVDWNPRAQSVRPEQPRRAPQSDGAGAVIPRRRRELALSLSKGILATGKHLVFSSGTSAT
jgi:hypothetical protein